MPFKGLKLSITQEDGAQPSFVASEYEHLGIAGELDTGLRSYR
jgi:hypothetical protein